MISPVKLAAVLFKLVVSVLLIWYAVAKIDLGGSVATLSSISTVSILAAGALFGTQFALAALRLRGLLEALGARMRFPAALDVIMIGSFFSQAFISFVGGDAMRVWRITRSQIPLAIAAKSVLLDRAAGFGGLIVLLLAATPFLVRIVESEMLFGLLLILLVAPGAIGLAFVLRRLPEKLSRSRLVTLGREVVDNALDIWWTRRGAAHLLWVSVSIQFLNVVILYVLAMGLGLEMTFLDGFLLFPAVLFLSMLPISFAGWGVREGAMVAALSLLGIPSHQSLALSVCFGLCVLTVSLPGGIVWLATRQPTARATSNQG